MEFLKKLFDSDFMPHGHCYFWKPEIVYTNAISDGLIALAYMTIPLSLFYIVRIRKDFSFHWLGLLFALFILGCGSTHIMDVINIWNPFYRLDSALRAITALASIGTAIMLIKITPQILLIPNATIFKQMNEKLNIANKDLEESYEELATREEQLILLNNELEEKIAERTIELKESEERFRTMADNISNLAWMANGDGWIFWYNKRWYDYTGTVPGQMEGWGWQSVQDPNELPKVMEGWAGAIKSGQPFDMVFRLKGADGIFRSFLTRVMPVRDEKGNITRWFGTHTDITEQIENENTLASKNKELAKINSDLDNFVYTASHDLKAPISNIEGLLNSLSDVVNKETQSSNEFQELLGMINISIEKFKNTIEDLTQISRVQKNIDEDIEDVSVSAIVEDVKLLFIKEIQKTNTTIKINTGKYPTIKFSKKNLNSIIYNILSNAIKYRSDDRKPLIEIETRLVDNYIELSIKDNGLGIPEDKIDKIFGMFKRLHNHVEGTGIGLYIVKRIIDNTGGKIEVESEINKGTNFKISFSI